MGKSFKNLAAWQRAMELGVAICGESRAMPDSERFGLTNQMRRSAVSVASNIAEGWGRGTRPEFLRFLRVARGSLCELTTQPQLAVTLQMMDPHVSVMDLIAETDRVLQGLIRNIEQKEAADDDGR